MFVLNLSPRSEGEGRAVFSGGALPGESGADKTKAVQSFQDHTSFESEITQDQATIVFAACNRRAKGYST